MSGKPALITPFASGNFPAGSAPWNGQPAAVAPPNPYLYPGDTYKPEYHNYLFGQGGVATNTANNWATVGALEWSVTVDTGSVFGYGAQHYDSYMGFWLYPLGNGTNPVLKLKMGSSSAALQSYVVDGGASFVNTVVAAVNPSNGVGFLFDNTNFVYFVPNSTGGTSSTEATSGIASQLASVSNGVGFYQSGRYYFVGFLASSGVSKVLGTAWGNTSLPTHGTWSGLAYPSSWDTGFANAAIPTVAVCNFTLSSLAATAYVGIQNNSPASLAYVANGGNTLVDITSGSPLATSGTRLNGLAADDANGLLVMSYTDSGGVTHVAYSSDPVGGVWTAAASTFTLSTYCLGVACVGGLWAIAFAKAHSFWYPSGGGANSAGVYLSSDLGATWFPSWGFADVSTAIANITAPFVASGGGLQCLRASGNQFSLAWFNSSSQPFFATCQPQGAATASGFTGAL